MSATLNKKDLGRLHLFYFVVINKHADTVSDKLPTNLYKTDMSYLYTNEMNQKKKKKILNKKKNVYIWPL